MSGYVLKPADAPATCVTDWRRGYLAGGERVARDLGWSILAVGPAPPSLSVIDQGVDATRSWATLAGGVPGQIYMISSRVRTTQERDLARLIVLRVALRTPPPTED